MDDGSGSSIWRRFGKLFQSRQGATVERLIREASEDGELDQQEGTMLQGVLTLDDLQVQDIMTPRTDIECVSDADDIRQAAEQIVQSGHSRLPVYSGTRDNIIGILHAKDLLEHLLHGSKLEEPASSFMRDAFFVPETKNVLDLLQEFRTRKNHLAVILDEYGGTAGLVSIEDVLEVIVGDIEDEHDAPREQDMIHLDDGGYLISGRAYLEDITAHLPVTIVSEDVDTLGGYIIHLAGRVPEAGETFEINGATFHVEEADARQIYCVRMLPLPGAGKQVADAERTPSSPVGKVPNASSSASVPPANDQRMSKPGQDAQKLEAHGGDVSEAAAAQDSSAA